MRIPLLVLSVTLLASSAALADQASDQSFFPDDSAKCASWSDFTPTDPQSAQMQIVMQNFTAEHLMRLDHALWHATRNGGMSAADMKVLKTLPGQMDANTQWGMNAPVCVGGQGPDQVAPSKPGEEFLLMHHGMVDMVRGKLVAANLPCITGWSALPEASDRNWPVPTWSPAPGEQPDDSKTDATGAMMAAWFTKFQDPKWLHGKSLSYVGYLLENSIHNYMHMRWADKPTSANNFSPTDGAKITHGSLLSSNPTYDAPAMDYLGNPYSAAVNPHFWKLHGFVDNTIEAWLKANGPASGGNYTTISKDCSKVTDPAHCYQWQSQWTGAMAMDTSMSSMKMAATPNRAAAKDPIQEALLARAINGSFKNSKRQAALAAKRGAAAPETLTATASGDGDPNDDPETFVKTYGPCAPSNGSGN